MTHCLVFMNYEVIVRWAKVSLREKDHVSYLIASV